jgi:hypothetical protein
LPVFIWSLALASSSSVMTTPLTAAKAPRNVVEPLGPLVPSRSTQPSLIDVLLPWKIRPKRTTKISGKANVQNSAARSRMKLRILAMLSWISACIRGP